MLRRWALNTLPALLFTAAFIVCELTHIFPVKTTHTLNIHEEHCINYFAYVRRKQDKLNGKGTELVLCWWSGSLELALCATGTTATADCQAAVCANCVQQWKLNTKN